MLISLLRALRRRPVYVALGDLHVVLVDAKDTTFLVLGDAGQIEVGTDRAGNVRVLPQHSSLGARAGRSVVEPALRLLDRLLGPTLPPRLRDESWRTAWSELAERGNR